MNLGRPHLPRIETDNSERSSQDYRFSLDTTSPFTPVGGQVSGIPFRLSTSTDDGRTSIELAKHTKLPSTDRARDERRKLLAHVLTQLRNRAMPPSVSDALGKFHDEVDHTWNLKYVVKTQIDKLQKHRDSDSDDEIQGYSTDYTFDLMVQLQEILVMSLEQRWDIFDDSGSPEKPLLSSDNSNRSSSTFRRSRSSFYNTRGKSRSPSPSRKNEVFASELLTLCISIFASVVTEDCRFRTNLPRPSRPPNALQAIVLNIAQVLLYINVNDAHIVSQISLALIPAFSTFNKEMYPRLIAFFDRGIIRSSLSSLQGLQGFKVDQSVVDDSVNHPLVSIHVDEVVEDTVQESDKTIWSPWTSTSKTLKIQSTNAPAQPISIYHLSSIVPPLLGCVLDNIEFESLNDKNLQTLRVFQKLLQSIVELKVDAYSDILQVVAYHTPKARKSAVTLLSFFWPLSVGHVVVSQPPTNQFFYQPQSSHNVPGKHQFTPWQFRHRHNWFSPGDTSQFDCAACRKAIHGFGLLCPQCTCGVHFDCYDHPDGNALVQCTNISDPHVRRVAMFRFSEYSDSRSSGDAESSSFDRHEFHQINLFTLSLCCACHQPLWGCASQGLRCGSCSQFVHSYCLGKKIPGPCGLITIDSTDLTIELSSLQLSCFEHYRDILDLSYQDLKSKSYEEISIFRDILSSQLQILEHGLALGALLITHKGKNIDHKHEGLPKFELHYTIKHCEELLAANSLYASPGVEEYLQENNLIRRDHSMLYTWSSLIYIVAAMKSPSTALDSSNATSSDFLNVARAPANPDAETNEVSHPFDMVSLSHMRDVLGHEFHVYSDAAAFVLLSHLHRLAFFSSMDDIDSNLLTMRENKDQSCSFPLPLGLDLSIDVETLVSAIEGCLSDVDLFVNEFGFLLLTRRMWPDGLMSDYGLKRLARGVFTWIINEDNQLAVILRDYLGKDRPLPGVPADLTNQWPPLHHERHAHSGPMQNSGDYLASRKTLLDLYAKRWLLALHNQDTNLYANSLFDACDELADRGGSSDARVLGYHATGDGDHLIQYERILHHILQLSQARVLYSVSDTIYSQWLEVVYLRGVLAKDVSSSILLKLLNRDPDHRSTTMIISTAGGFADRSAGLETDPWQIIVNTSRASRSGLEKGLCWLGLLSRSGIEVPLNIYNQFIAILGIADDTLQNSCSFIKSTFASLWLRSIGRQQCHKPLTEFYLSLVPKIHEAFLQSSGRNALAIVRYTLASCLLLYGCDRTELVSAGLVEDGLVSSLPSRRRLERETVHLEPLLIDGAVVQSIDLHLKAGDRDIMSMIVRFLYVFFTSHSFVEPHEMDNFVLKHGYLLSHCTWRFYDVQQPEIAQLRITVLLRVLSVDPEEFKILLEQGLAHDQGWEERASCASRLFRIIQDVCNPTFSVDDRQWKSSIANVFQKFFSLLWADPKEEVRLVAKVHCSTLLPAHLGAITSCFDETMTRAPVVDRIRLASFLTQLRVHFPAWQVLSWDALLEVLAETDGDHRLYPDANARNYGTITGGDPELSQLNVSLVVLALDMLSDGIDADSLTLIKIKAQLVRLLGFQNVSVVPADANGQWLHLVYGELKSISELSYPCFGGLVSLLDSWNKIELPSPVVMTISQDDKGVEVLIGTLYADIPLQLLATYEGLLDLPVLVIKNLLEAVHVIIYKHDFENRNLSVFSSQISRRAIAQILNFLEADVPYEVRHVALSIVQVFVEKSTTITSPMILRVMERIMRVVTVQANDLTQDSLVEQGYLFIGDTFEKYCKSGLFINILKHPLPREMFLVLNHTMDRTKGPSPGLKDDLLWDTLSRLQEIEGSLLQNLLTNLHNFVELVHPKHHSAELMSLAGKQLTNLAQRMSDGNGPVVDASPLFSIAAALLQYNKTNSKDLLPYIDTLIRVTLTRLSVSRESISNLLMATAGLRRRSRPQDSSPTINAVIPTVFEVLGDGLRLKTKLLAITLRSTLEAVAATELSPAVTPITLHSHLLAGLADGGCYWLDNYYWGEGQTEQDFHASLAVARMIFQTASYGTPMSETLFDQKNSRFQLRSMRAWNILAMATLSSNADSSLAPQLFKHLKSFSVVYTNSLWPYIKSNGLVPDSVTADINHAYIAMKLWLMIANQSEDARQLGEPIYYAVWDELWPPFESMVSGLEAEAQSGVTPTTADFLASSITDLFLFVTSLRVPAGLQRLTQRTILKRLQNLVQGESVMIKLNRGLEGLAETPPETPLETLVDQAAKDIIATEKLRLLGTKHGQSRATGDRRVNIEKKTTIDKLNWRDVKLPYT